MAVVYATLIVKGKKTIDQVPSLIRSRSRRSWQILKSPSDHGIDTEGSSFAGAALLITRRGGLRDDAQGDFVWLGEVRCLCC